MTMNTSRGVGDGKYPTLGALETNADSAIREGDLLFIASTGEAYQATTDVSASVILNTSPQLYANLRSGGGSGGSTDWGGIGGTLSNQTDLQNALDDKVDTVAGKGLSKNDYTDTDKSSVDSLGSLSELDVPASDGKTYGVKDGALVEIPSGGGGSVDWGGIGGTLSNQTDLNNTLNSKVDTVAGKGLSTNDYDNTAAQEVAKVTDKVDKVAGKGLSENDYTDTDKSSVDALGSLSELDVPASDGKTYGVKDGALAEIPSGTGGSEFKTIANSANLASIDSVWNPEANASVPEYISNAERHVIANPYGTSPVITKVFVRSAASGLTEWFDPRWLFNDSAAASLGVAAEPLGSTSIVIQTATYQTVPPSSTSGSSANRSTPSINPTDLQVMVLVQKL